MFWKRFYILCEKHKTKPLNVVNTLSIGAGSITKWKNGSIPNSETLLKIADYFNVTVDYLLGRDEISQNQIITLDETVIAYMKLDEIDRAEIKGTIKQMLKADKYSVKTNLSDYAELAAEGGTETRGRKKKKVEILE